VETNLRQLDICSPTDLNEAIPDTVLIGLGGIGSTVMLALAKMGLRKIEAFDPDTLEEQNIGNQFLPPA
jgi:tRNA A37 threonylcarbamoyladenosine dehydratase